LGTFGGHKNTADKRTKSQLFEKEVVWRPSFLHAVGEGNRELLEKTENRSGIHSTPEEKKGSREPSNVKRNQKVTMRRQFSRKKKRVNGNASGNLNVKIIQGPERKQAPNILPRDSKGPTSGF